MNIAIIGLGPYGLCVLATLLDYIDCENKIVSSELNKLTIHIFEPKLPGPGVHSMDLPDYLLLNTACEQLDLNPKFHFSGSNTARYYSFVEWLDANNARYGELGSVEFDGSGRRISPGDYLPRSIFGSYLRDFYDHLVNAYRSRLSIVHHTSHVSAIRRVDEQEKIFTSSLEIIVDHVFVAVGHIENMPDKDDIDYRYLSPYPVTNLLETPRARQKVGIAGIGLVALDVLTALTIGRGGYYKNSGYQGKLSYVRSGNEPYIYLFSRSGRPFCCRPSQSVDKTGKYKPVLFTMDAINNLKIQFKENLDFESHVLPLLMAEMTIAYYVGCSDTEGSNESSAIRSNLAAAWKANKFQECVKLFSNKYGSFDPWLLLVNFKNTTFECSADYESWFRENLVNDINEAEKGEARSPRKQALELLRTLREEIRFAVEYYGLNSNSLKDFYRSYTSLFNSIVVGPPIQRGRELLALIEAGVVSLPFGRSPQIMHDATDGGWILSSTHLSTPISKRVDYIVRGYVDMPHLDRTKSELIKQLKNEGRVRLSEASNGGLEVDRNGSPINSQGAPEQQITVLGPVTEGCRYFTHYVPSPGSRYRAFMDAARAIHCLFSRRYNRINQ